MDTKNQIIYVYSTETLMYNKTIHKPAGDVHFKPWFKIGMTTQETADDRIIQQDRTSNPEKLIKLYDINIQGECISAYELEQKIHDYYDRFGQRVRHGREWFEVEGGVDEIKKVIESILDNSDLHKSEIRLKPHQIEANTKINECFNSDDKRCLLAHKPRSGKTFTTIYNIKENNYKNVVILTSYPILNFQWEEVILGFKGFSNTEIIIGSGLSKIELNPDKNSIVLLSLQDVKGGEEVFEKEKFDIIKDIEFDLLVIDEVHYGVETEKTQDFLNKIKYTRMLGLSATPTRNLLCGRFSKEQIHNYTLVEEVKLKKQYPELYPYADINFLIWNLSSSEKSELKYFSDEEQFKFDKLFRIEGVVYKDDNKKVIDYESGYFQYKSDLIYLFKKLIGDRDICRRDKLGTQYPFKNNGEFSVVKSILLFLPNIHAQYKLKSLLQELESYDDFNIHITNSNEYSSNQLIKRIRREFKSGDKRSIILAVDQLTTGITLDDCDMVALMNDWRSVDKYVQSSFRCQSPRDGKENCWVLDFNAARSFELMWEYQNIISKNNGKGITENIKEWVECVNIFNRVDGEFKRVDFDGFNNEYNKAVLERPRFNYQSVILQDRLSDVEVWKALQAIGIKGGSSSSEEDLNDDGIERGKSKKGKDDAGSKNTEKKDEISQVKLMEIAKALVDKTMLLSIFTYFKYDNVDDCFNALLEDNTVVEGIGELERKMYLETLLLGMNDVDKVDLSIIKYIYDNIFDKEIVNKKMYLFNQNVNLIYNSMGENPHSINIMLSNLMELVDSYLKPSSTEKRLLGEVFTPLYGKPGCVEDQLNLMDESFWKRKDVKVLDPCAGIGNYSVVLVDKFMKGLADEIPDSEERLKWILEEIIYINEYQSKNLFIYLQLFDPENKYKMNFNRGDYLKLDIKETFGVEKFDLICMNSPYQEMDGGGNGSSAKPVYNKFIEKAICESDNIISINPNRWFSGGKGLDSFRKMMLNRKDIKSLIIINDEKSVFGNNVSIAGGVSYFLIDKDYNGLTLVNDKLIDLSKNDVLIPDDIINSIINKVTHSFKSFEDIVLPRNPFSLKNKKWSENGITVITKDGNKKLEISEITDKYNITNKYKCLISKANGNAFTKRKYITSYKISHPNTISSETYLVCGSFETENEAENVGVYLLTKFARFLLSLRMSGQNNSKDKFYYVPQVDFTKKWTDEDLYKYYNLSEDEIILINKSVL
jgi:superfamily II DNA or RNA helicase